MITEHEFASVRLNRNESLSEPQVGERETSEERAQQGPGENYFRPPEATFFRLVPTVFKLFERPVTVMLKRKMFCDCRQVFACFTSACSHMPIRIRGRQHSV